MAEESNFSLAPASQLSLLGQQVLLKLRDEAHCRGLLVGLPALSLQHALSIPEEKIWSSADDFISNPLPQHASTAMLFEKQGSLKRSTAKFCRFL